MKSEWDLLSAQWMDGPQTREAALRLLFLSWYACSEPLHLSGLEEVDLQESLIDELFKFLGGEGAEDEEILFVIAVMSEVAPWCLGDNERWSKIAKIFKAKLDRKIPAPELFTGRGSYGEYFEYQAQTQSQYILQANENRDKF
jgi:hypothetical protein